MKLAVFASVLFATFPFSIVGADTTKSGSDGGTYRAGKLVRYKYTDKTEELYTYDSKGSMVEFRDRAGKTVRFMFAPDGTAKTVEVPEKSSPR